MLSRQRPPWAPCQGRLSRARELTERGMPPPATSLLGPHTCARPLCSECGIQQAVGLGSSPLPLHPTAPAPGLGWGWSCLRRQDAGAHPSQAAHLGGGGIPVCRKPARSLSASPPVSMIPNRACDALPSTTACLSLTPTLLPEPLVVSGTPLPGVTYLPLAQFFYLGLWGL